MPGLILEGIVGTGKTTLYRKLLTDMPLATLALPEHYTERAHEHRPDRTLADSLLLLDRIMTPIESLSALHSEGKFSNSPDLAFQVLLERFHLSHSVMFASGDFSHYLEIDQRLAAMQIKLVVLMVGESLLPDRLARTRATRNDGWSWYLDHKVAKRTPDDSDADVQARLVAHFAAEQRHILELAQQSRLETLVVSTDTENWDTLAADIRRF